MPNGKLLVQPIPVEGGAENSVRVVEYPAQVSDLQDIVGGTFRIVPLDEPFCAIVNDDGSATEPNGPFCGVWCIAALTEHGTLRGLTDEEVLFFTDIREGVT